MKSMKRKKLFGWVALVSLAGATPALAHHSTAMYDYKNTKTLSGTVKMFQWTNPHMFISSTVDAPGDRQEIDGESPLR